ncbi:MAG TPA: DUF2784 domain-containing protein [Gemmatimonadota bacterium]|nr:DUF2784 domain-containing protein [Gemmatimonadota bacterium]
MIASLMADVVLLAHAAFAAFVAVGGFLVLRWPRVAWLHVPCALYGAAIELVGWTCPLTPLEQGLRRTAGRAGYSGGFLDHYVGGILYPAGWEHIHVWLGVAVVAGNVALYGAAAARARRRAGGTGEPPA